MEQTKKLHETNTYSDYAFPYEMYRVNKHGMTPPGRGYLDLHWHEELQFTLVTAGTITMQVNGDAYHLSKGEAIFINSGMIHITTNISPGGEYVSFNFPDKLLAFFAGSRMEQTYVLPYTKNYALPVTVFSAEIPWQNEIIECLKELEHCIHNTSIFGFEYLISLKTTSMWYLFIKHISEIPAQPSAGYIRKQERIQTLVSYIHKHYASDISLSDIADSAHISTAECCRCFKSMLHTTPRDYLKEYRINKSIELLNNRDYSITEISTLSGYNYVSHFIRHFKEKTHKTPSEYRRSRAEQI